MTWGRACLAMWWTMEPAMRAEFEHWHSHEHFPERLRIPGFHRASRWMDAEGGDGVFVFYELESHAVLSSAPYLERLNAPTPWSTRLMPHHRHMVRSQCHVLESAGASVARHAATLRFSPADAGAQDALQQQIGRDLAALALRAGCAGGHLLRHQQPAMAQTTEQKIRGGDAAADWVLVLTGHDADVLRGLMREEFGDAALTARGAGGPFTRGLYVLSHSATAVDVAGLGAPGGGLSPP